MFRSRLLFLLLSLAPLAGCGGGPGELYEPAWKYPLRTDPVVVSLPTTQPVTRHEMGRLDESIARLSEIGGEVLLPDALSDDQKQTLTATLDALFGTPAAPAIADIDPATADRFALQPDSLKVTAGRYKVSCSNCHGLSGDGRGTAGLWTDPHPRDFRSGKFKTVTGAGASAGRPRFADLVRVIQRGVPGSTMGATGLPDAEARQLAGYTLFLSVRGEVELELIRQLADPAEAPDDIEKEARRLIPKVLQKWIDNDAEQPVAHQVQDRPEGVTPEYAESIRRGQKLFNSADAGCASCHVDYGRADTFRYDVWGVPNRVRNLTEQYRHWAREPVDLARQLRHGIPAANMPAVPLLTDQQVADLIHFVRELPYPLRLPDDVKAEVYPK